MLTCFLAEKGVKCKIVKYVERIWLKKGNDASKIMRAFIVDVSPESTKPLEKLSFIIPRLVKKSDIEDFSHLSTNSKCFVNQEGRTTGDINIIDENRIIFDDFDCRVNHKHTIRPHSSGKATRIDIGLINKSIAPGEKELFRLGLAINNLIDEVPSITTFKFSYFAIEDCKKDIFLELSNAYDIIPILPICDEGSLQGGFDIFLYAPPDNEIASPIGNYNHVSLKHDHKGKLLNTGLNGIRWRLRDLVDSPNKEIILGKNNDFSSRKKFHGTIRTPIHFKDIEELKKSTKKLEKSAKETKDSSTKSRIISIIAVIAAVIIPLLLYFFSKTPPP